MRGGAPLVCRRVLFVVFFDVCGGGSMKNQWRQLRDIEAMLDESDPFDEVIE